MGQHIGLYAEKVLAAPLPWTRMRHDHDERRRVLGAQSVGVDLVAALKRLKLGRVLDALPERLALAATQDMPREDFLLLLTEYLKSL